MYLHDLLHISCAQPLQGFSGLPGVTAEQGSSLFVSAGESCVTTDMMVARSGRLQSQTYNSCL